ncbi:MFS transporter [Martelella soudanensis]|uniref:hypothetical protein n=1 Tax=unclassified Martelella TaxID=2629616 RepID=UPI0015DFA144|nr:MULTISPECIES: hypothetical protein [unclassified Martelella]
MAATLSLARLVSVLAAAGGIYTAQSLIGGLTFMGVPIVLRASDVALDRIGLVSLTMLVWALKFLWSPPVERWRIRPDGRRRSRAIILAGEGMAAVLLVALALADIGRFELVLSGLIALAVVAATVDIACDAFLIEQSPPDRRGFANIAQVGGGYLGMIFGSGLFVVVYSRLMALVGAHQPGVDFTLFQSASAIGAAAFGAGGGLIAAHAGYAVSFGLAAVLSAIALPLLRRMDIRLNKGNAP